MRLTSTFGKLLLLPLLVSAFFLASTAPVSAQLKNPQSTLKNLEKTAGSAGFDVEQRDLPALVGSIIGGLLGILGVVFVILMIYGGYLFMSAQGNEDQVEKAKDIIKNAVIGIVIIFLAYAITTFVIGAISGSEEAAADQGPAGGQPLTQ